MKFGSLSRKPWYHPFGLCGRSSDLVTTPAGLQRLLSMLEDKLGHSGLIFNPAKYATTANFV